MAIDSSEFSSKGRIEKQLAQINQRLFLSQQPRPGTISLDELTASKLFLKYSNEIQTWISTSPRGDVLRAILGRQGSIVDKESLELLKDIVEEEKDNVDVTTDATMMAEVIGLLDTLISKL
jgi:hypothetical protein